MPSDPLPHSAAQPHHAVPGAPIHLNTRAAPSAPAASAATASGHATPPKAGPINRLKGAGTPKDTIPIAKTPRKQRSSRFHVSEKVEIQRLPGFMGAPRPLTLLKCPARRAFYDHDHEESTLTAHAEHQTTTLTYLYPVFN